MIFSFFSHKFNIEKTVKGIPLITAIGLLVFALFPLLFKAYAYTGIVVGTVIFSASAGLCEVLISPVIAALPAKNPAREMSKLHSIYAWGVVGVVLFSTLFLLLFGKESWHILALIWLIIPLLSSILFLNTSLPPMQTPEKAKGALKIMFNKNMLFCMLMIFLGGASECSMAQWASGYLEKAMGITKVFGDVFGVAMFAVMLGLGRTLYAKKGKHIEHVLFYGAIGAFCCYILAIFTSVPFIALFACAFTGFFTSMLWPGSLVVAEKKVLHGGVAMYALMAAGGDLGASVAPQLVGTVTDLVAQSTSALSFAQSLHLSPEQLGMKAGLLCASFFPLCAIFVFMALIKKKKA